MSVRRGKFAAYALFLGLYARFTRFLAGLTFRCGHISKLSESTFGRAGITVQERPFRFIITRGTLDAASLSAGLALRTARDAVELVVICAIRTLFVTFVLIKNGVIVDRITTLTLFSFTSACLARVSTLESERETTLY